MLYQGDKAPKAVPFEILDPAAGTVSVVLRITKPSSATSVTWSTVNLVITSEKITFDHVLASDGSDLPDYGYYVARVFMLNAGGAVVGDTDEFKFPVLRQYVQ